jgi:hypothetical protein
MSFPVGLSNGPPPSGKAPNGRNGLADVAAAGVAFIRTGRADWNAQQIDAQIAAERTLLDAAEAHGLHGWLWLGDLPNLPAGTTSPQAKLLSAGELKPPVVAMLCGILFTLVLTLVADAIR